MEILDFKYSNEDALKFMKTLPDSSVKLIITSPPYNVGKEVANVIREGRSNPTVPIIMSGIEPEDIID